MQTREDILVLQEKVEHLAARVDAMETEVESIQQELQQQAAANSADRSRTAAAYGVTVRSIVEANDIPNPDRLRVGQKLFIPE